jgi:hypothetical protein
MFDMVSHNRRQTQLIANASSIIDSAYCWKLKARMQLLNDLEEDLQMLRDFYDIIFNRIKDRFDNRRLIINRLINKSLI